MFKQDAVTERYIVVACVSKFTPHQLVIADGMLTPLGLVLGLVVSFRTSSAYERCVFFSGLRVFPRLKLTCEGLERAGSSGLI